MDCGHLCCDIRKSCNHSHTVDPNDCALCDRVRNGDPLPLISTTKIADKNEDE